MVEKDSSDEDSNCLKYLFADFLDGTTLACSFTSVSASSRARVLYMRSLMPRLSPGELVAWLCPVRDSNGDQAHEQAASVARHIGMSPVSPTTNTAVAVTKPATNPLSGTEITSS
ncbi:hypothetical protein HW555_001735 [Spodoptera exigua]|uniref:Uncharacterized protein n=1 Tax=Spodoptera exigua TaxID=7107 RepID=A0A835GQ66_SPOEX|nr:hypothetical protein HW555_001735 [Spodoptera exigua]